MRVEQRGQVYLAGCEQIAHVAGGADMVCGWEGEVLQLVLPVSQILVVGVCIRAGVSAEMKVITVIIHCRLQPSSSPQHHGQPRHLGRGE